MASLQPAHLLGVFLVVLPGAYSWWDGRRLIARLADPALPERFLAYSMRQVFVLVACLTILVLRGPFNLWAGATIQFVIWMAGGFAARRAVYEETWNFPAYFWAQVRLVLVFGGLLLAIALAPAVILTFDQARWTAAGVVAALMLAWIVFSRALILRLVGARPWDLDPSQQAILSRARVATPLAYRFGFTGGRFANAFAMPTTARSAVLVSDTLLESMTAEEQSAVLAHEVAHLEHYTPTRVWRSAAGYAAAVLLATLGAAVAFDLPDSSPKMLAGGWAAMVALLAAVLQARHAKHETESDLRAVELCGDAEALIRALTKIHALGRLPRQWDQEMDQSTSHPSLRRRIQAIRAAAQISSDKLTEPVVVAGKTPGSLVILEAERISWLEGVPADVPREPRALLEKATSVESASYSDLVELRIDETWRGKVFLRSTERGAKSRGVELEPDSLASLQAALRVVDLHLATSVVTSWPVLAPLLGMILVLVALRTHAPGALLFGGFVVTFRPGRAALAAIAVMTGVAAVIQALGSDIGATLWQHYGLIAGLAAVAAIASWAAWHTPYDRPGRRGFGPTLPASVLAALALPYACISLGLFTNDKMAAFLLLDALVAALGAAAACLIYRPLLVRMAAGVSMVVVGLAAASLLIVPRNGVRNLRWSDRTLVLLQRVEFPAWASALQLGPSSTTYALRSEQPGSQYRAGRFGGEQYDVDAADVRFLDDDHLLAMVRTDTGLMLHTVNLDGAQRVPWSVILPEAQGAWLGVTPETGDWVAVAWMEKEPENAARRVAFFGRVGQSSFRTRTWPEAAESDRFHPLGGRHVVEVRPRAARPTHGLWSQEATDLWLWDQDSDRQLAGWPVPAYCTGPVFADTPLPCLGSSVVAGHLWLISSGAGEVTGPLKVRGEPLGWGAGKGSVVARYEGGRYVVVDFFTGEGYRFSDPEFNEKDPAFPEAFPSKNRMVILSARQKGSTLSLYRIQ